MNKDNGIETSNKDEHDESASVWVKNIVYSLARSEFIHIHSLLRTNKESKKMNEINEILTDCCGCTQANKIYESGKLATAMTMADCRACAHFTGKYCGSIALCTNADQWKQGYLLQMWKKTSPAGGGAHNAGSEGQNLP